uniref:Shelterin complex subunit TPP1/Est3 domain-containing protein n=1 Tax=Neogobius melanostomus TaxID=47308 RepID=A0A8C6WYA9_9GOBI
MPVRRGLTPWIEKLIESYDGNEGIRTAGLQAHVVGVGRMSQSQALGSEGPTGLLYLSDEHVQIKAVLTDLECFSSLVDHSVCITDYMLLFHCSSEQSRSCFYLSVGKLGTRAVVGMKNITPCCTSLPSVRKKICQTWRVMLSQQDTQKSQSGFNLTELLGEWQQDCLQTELEHVQKLLSPQPSTSTLNPTVTLKSFAVPVQSLLIPDAPRPLNAQPQTGSENVGPSEILETSPDSTDPQISLSEGTTKPQSTSEDTVNALEDGPVVPSGSGTSPVSNPWDMCPPPSNTSSTKSSPQASPVPNSPIFTESSTHLCPVDTSTQISAHSKGASPPEDVMQILEKDAEEQVGRSPPSWMFDSLMVSTSEQSISQTQVPPGGQLSVVHPSVHGDGMPFSYTYQVNGQELQHLSRFSVGQDLLQWAVKYLLRPEHGNLSSASATAPQAEDGHIIIS